MAKTLGMAKETYRKKLEFMPGNYQKGMEDFFGTGSGGLSGAAPVSNYKGVMVPGKENDWERKLKQAFGIR